MRFRETSAWTVELVGLPGVGKSSAVSNVLAKNVNGFVLLKGAVSPNLGSSGLRFFFIKLIAAIVISAPVCCARLLFSRNGRWLLAKVAYRLSLADSIDEPGETIILQDSGTLQPFVSLLAEERNDRRVKPHDLVALLKIIPLPKQVFVFDDSEVEILSRYRERARTEGSRVGAVVSHFRYSEARSFMLTYMITTLLERGVKVHVLRGLGSFQNFDLYLKES